jgi:hypothetical protein
MISELDVNRPYTPSSLLPFFYGNVYSGWGAKKMATARILFAKKGWRIDSNLFPVSSIHALAASPKWCVKE